MQGLRAYFDSNPVDDLVLLNVHEFVHTQQNPIVHHLLFQSLYEGVAEFVSAKAMNVSSAVPAIKFGKANEEKVRQKFELDMFKGNKTNEWLWSNAENEFGVRDLGYYIGYEISERYYNNAKDKSAALKKMIELDYTNENEVEKFVDGAGYFSKPLNELRQTFESKRPTVLSLKPFRNGSQTVPPSTTQITIEFSESIDQRYRNFDYGPLGEDASIRVKNKVHFSEDGKSITFGIEDLKPNKRYQLVIGSGFRNKNGIPLKPFLIDFKTRLK